MVSIKNKAIELVRNALSSINVVLREWENIDDQTKTEFLPRIKKLKRYKTALEEWKNRFNSPKTNKDELLFNLHTLMLEMG